MLKWGRDRIIKRAKTRPQAKEFIYWEEVIASTRGRGRKSRLEGKGADLESKRNPRSIACSFFSKTVSIFFHGRGERGKRSKKGCVHRLGSSQLEGTLKTLQGGFRGLRGGLQTMRAFKLEKREESSRRP